MTINSMTGFARMSGAHGEHSWLWEIKSVNGRGLEIRCRIPSGFDQLEDKLRKLIKATFQRGSINLQLQLETTSASSHFRINEEFLNELLIVAESYVQEGRARPPRMDGMMGLKGVIEVDEHSGNKTRDPDLETALLASATELLEKLVAMREDEGRQLLPVLSGQLEEIDALVSRGSELAADWPEYSRKRLKVQMERLMGEAGNLDASRLEQELALLATKADITEELDRLASHIAATRDMLEGGAAEGIGRRLDFMCQEFNREANTLCSKVNDKELTQVGLDLKVLIDRMREQVQNIE